MIWPPRDWRALIALLGSIAGAASLTGFLVYGYWLNANGGRWTAATETIRAITSRWILWIVATGIVVVLVSLGLAINRRSIKGQLSRDGASLALEGGEDDASPPPVPVPIPVPPVTFGSGAAQ